jgi:DtxR family Mn-dependent transcriptional regulator
VEEPTRSLTELPVGQRAILVRVSDFDPEMLRYLARCGVALGDAVEMLEKEPFGGPLRVRFAGQVHTVGRELAGAMRVELRA